MGRKSKICRGCGHPSGIATIYNLILCNACKIVEQPSSDGKAILIYIKTVGKKDLTYITTVPKR